jgi:SAM-dependent methyltransferase
VVAVAREINEPDIEYVGLMAEAWDARHGDTSTWEDRQLFLELIRACGEPVLDVGCGTGQLLLDFRGLGIEAGGVDNSAQMLALCKRKAEKPAHGRPISNAHGDFRNMDLGPIAHAVLRATLIRCAGDRTSPNCAGKLECKDASERAPAASGIAVLKINWPLVQLYSGVRLNENARYSELVT